MSFLSRLRSVALVASAAALVSASNVAAQVPLRLAVLTPAMHGASPDVPARDREPFVDAGWRDASGVIVAKWMQTAFDIARDRRALARCRRDAGPCDPASRRMLAIIDAARDLRGRARIGHLNRAINLSIRPITDEAQHGVADHWSSPLATLAAGRGDCEDYAIAKYLALREAGIAASDLRLVVVRLPPADLDHAVLAVRHEERWLILDNRRLALLEAGDLKAEPLFVLGESAVRARGAKAAAAAADGMASAVGVAAGGLPALM